MEELTVTQKTLLTASTASDGHGVVGFQFFVDGVAVAEALPTDIKDGRIEFKDVPVEAGSRVVKIRANLIPYIETEEKTVNVGS
jgi:hypothetical protein